MTSKTTRHTQFGGDYQGNNNLFSVNAGVEVFYALGHVAGTLDSIRERLNVAIGNADQITVEEAWLMRDAIASAQALLEAIE